MQQKYLKIISNTALNPVTYEMVLAGEGIKMRAGQFAELSVDGFFLRRPISVCASEDDRLTLVYKIVGQGTKKMSVICENDGCDALIGLGNGFDTEGVKKPLLIGGGIGCAPLFELARVFAEQGITPVTALAFKSKEEVFYADRFAAYGEVIIATDDGSLGYKGNAVQTVKRLNPEFDRYYACGPSVMLRAVKDFSLDGQLSLEARMGCGFGACMGCSIKTTDGFKRVCKEGPVFDAETVIFE